MCSFSAMLLSLSLSFIILITLQPTVSNKLPYPEECNQASENVYLSPQHFKHYKKCPHQICEDQKYYPCIEIWKEMNKVTGNNPINSLFGELFKTQEMNRVLHSRVGGGTRSNTPQPLCGVTKTSLRPTVMKNVNGIWRYIVNVDKYKQTYTSEYCNNRININVGHNNIVCKQKTQRIPLLVFENGRIFYDEFEINTTCDSSCGLKS
ncbi:uncharacterized protein LOC126885179 [Diabrotica virgifera virgifera]|uniref:Spaetzle domain-containing protein n=1 Tax=Diabrotica virgifera virgifera TaxID=50390 RepID=A0ABM5KBK5_DIAVI|nr:uncharacterized protein LOC126885179 [Diabrotica virgifera virgifera]